ncbi:platelet-derived growth factor subunit A [Elysia marginata]|uniref:Platelet-derived growth factor subunit A n=1 Tax=Elysia marginata TaxID=1093978 RepID=A0AAV4G8R4_9GAST|nr:platelet-derived growth factor subunit A [Elysia marginata]
MALIFNYVSLALLTVFILGVISQETDQVSETNATEIEDQASGNSTEEDDNSFSDPFVRLMNASSIEEALAMNVIYKDNHIATAADLGAVPDPNTGKLMVSGGSGGFAIPDGCHPRDTTVKIHVKDLSPTSRLYPRCIKVSRCGGCCGTPNVECVPLYIEREVYNVSSVCHNHLN